MKNLKIEFKWAAIFVVMMLVWMFLERLVGLHDEYIAQHAIYTNFIAIPAVAIYVLALRDKRRSFYGGAMSYKEGFIAGTIITVILTLLTPLIQYTISTWITPEYFANISTYSVAAGELTAAEAEAHFTLQNYMVMATIGAFIMGMITTAVVAYFTKTAKSADAPATSDKGYAM